MASSSANLRKALNLIRQGKQAKARPLLTQVLRQEPNNAQAWFLLSYALDEAPQQEYALLQALKADPKFERALRRLAQLRGRPLSESEVIAAQKHSVPADTAPAVAEEQLEQKATPTFAEFVGQPEEIDKQPRRNWLRLIAFGLLVFVLAVAAYAGYQYYAPQLAAAFPSATPIATRALPATWTPGAPVTPTAAVSATPTPMVFTAVNPAALAEMQAISQLITDMRGLSFANEPQNYFVANSDLLPFLAATLLDEAKAQELAAEELALRAIGLLGQENFMTDYQLNRHVDPFGGLYDEAQNRILLLGSSFGGTTPYTYARLAANAMLRQAQPALAAEVSDCPVFSDRCRALNALLGGDWSLAAEQWLEVNGSDELKQAVAEAGDPVQLIQAQAPVDFTQLDLQFPAIEGKQFVQAAFDEGEWVRVDDVYATVPLSSEQILHPEKYVAGESPSAMQDASLGTVLGSGWTPLVSGDLGEWLTYLLLAHGVNADAQVAESSARAAAAGWNGDQLQVYLRGVDSSLALAEHWTMDSAQDATQLQSTLRQLISALYPQAGSALGDGECWVGVNVRTCLFASGSDVVWLIGPDEIVVLQVMLAQYPQFQE